MIIDTSALIAILQREPEEDRIIAAINCNPVRYIAAPNVLEASLIAMSRRGDAGVRDLDLLMNRLEIDIVEFTAEHIRFARRAFKLFGKGVHPARLNFGDCIAYALSKHSDEPLLFKGTDFHQTDVAVASY